LFHSLWFGQRQATSVFIPVFLDFWRFGRPMRSSPHKSVSLAGGPLRYGLWPAADQPQDIIVTTDRQTAIAARAHQIWEEAGHPHGQDAEHWQQAEREHDKAEVRAAAVEQFNAETVEVAPAKPTRKRAAKVVEVVGDAPAVPPVRKVRTSRKALVPAPMN
jgi:hypothetical protein